MDWLLSPQEPYKKLAEIEFFVPGSPRPQLRAGRRAMVNKNTGKMSVHTFPQEKNVASMEDIRFAWKDRLREDTRELPSLPYAGPIRLRVRFSFSPTKTSTWPGKVMSKKPDVDNLLKMLEDALNNYAWVDDSQIVGVIAEKGYSDTPGTLCVMEMWEDVAKPIKRKSRIS